MTLINTLSGPCALWIPLRKTLHDHLPPLGSVPNDVNTSSRAYTEAYVPVNRFSHKSCVCTHVTHMLHERTHTHLCFMKPTVCVTSGCLVTSQSTRQDSIRSWSATARPSSVTKYIERHYIVGDSVCVCVGIASRHIQQYDFHSP